jgi:error-prone DNA polymerase
MIGCRGKVQREGEVVHMIAERLTDLSGLLGQVGEREEAFRLPHGRGDEAKHGGGADPRGALGRKPMDIYIPDLRIEGAIHVRTRDFR